MKKLSGKTGPVGGYSGRNGWNFLGAPSKYFILPEFSRNGKCCAEGVRSIFVIFTLKLRRDIGE